MSLQSLYSTVRDYVLDRGFTLPPYVLPDYTGYPPITPPAADLQESYECIHKNAQVHGFYTDGTINVPVTDTLPGGVVWSRNAFYTTLADCKSMTVRLELDYPGGAGLVFEAGGTSWGSVGYIKSDGTFVFKTGGNQAGQSPLANSKNGRVSTTIPTGTSIVEISVFTTDTEANLAVWVDGEFRAQTSSFLPDANINGRVLVGGDPGTIEQVSNASAAIDFGVPTTFPNVVTLCKVWRNVYVSP